MKRLALLAVAAGAYVLAAWITVPGFFDGFAPPSPYNWVSPPPDFRNANRPPSSGSATIRIESGVSQPGSLSTPDSQVTVAFPARSFEIPAGVSSVRLDLRPVATYPDLGGVSPASNVYQISASARLVSPIVVTLRYVQLRSDLPDHVFTAADPAGPWKSIGLVASAVPSTLAASAQSLGYFVAGYPAAGATAGAGQSGAGGGGGGEGGGPGLPLVVGIGVVVLLLATIPILLAQRRQGGSKRDAADVRSAAAPPPSNLGGAKRSRRRRRRR